jgi:hypothetical protein
MFKKILEGLHGAKIDSLSKSFIRLGWVGFWFQVVLGALPVVLMFYLFVFSGSLSGPRSGMPLVEFLSLVNLLVLLFTIVWFYRYPTLGRRIADPQARPGESTILGSVWTGLVATSLGILFSMTVMVLEVGATPLLFPLRPAGGYSRHPDDGCRLGQLGVRGRSGEPDGPAADARRRGDRPGAGPLADVPDHPDQRTGLRSGRVRRQAILA